MRPRFTLRFFLIAFATIADLFDGAANFYFGEKAAFTRHQQAIEKLKGKGILVETFMLADPNHLGDSWKQRFVRKWFNERAYPVTGRLQLNFSPGALPHIRTTEALDLLKEVQCLREIKLIDQRMSREVVEKIGRLPELEGLELQCDGVDEDAVDPIRRWRKLQRFGYRGNLGDPALQQIFALPKLESLQIQGQKLSEVALTSLSKSASIKEIFVWDTEITRELLDAMRSMPQLWGVAFLESTFQPGAAESLAKLKQLRVLQIHGAKNLPGDFCDTLAQLENIEYFSVWRCEPFTSQQAAQLAKCLRLRILWLKQTQLTDEDFSQFIDHPCLGEIEIVGEPDRRLILAFLKKLPNRRVTVLTTPDGWDGNEFTLEGDKLIATKLNRVK